MAKIKSRMRYVKKLDSVFSRYVRLVRSNNGICKCITCGKESHRTAIQNGHFVSRKVYRYRWDLSNCHPQCSGCNIFLRGNYQAYTLKMIDMLGRARVEEMLADKSLYKILTPELEKLIEHYSSEVERLMQNLGN